MTTRPSPDGHWLSERDFSERLLYSGFLLLVGVGYLMALILLYYTHQGHDGKPGLSVEDIAYSYHGNRSGTRLEAAIRGPMSAYLGSEERQEIVAWLSDGASEGAFAAKIEPILKKNCLMCHSKKAGLGLPDFSTYDGVRQVADVDTGMSLMSLVRVSHIHLFGIGLIVFAVGMIFRLSCLGSGIKNTLVVTPFAAVFVDIAAWFLTKWDYHYALVVVIAGAVLGLSLAAQIFISLYQMWLGRRPSQCSLPPRGGAPDC
ncbi:MAG TPA: hypothetical protein ENJ19_08485 [Gammaproteobacteria bacterium]|nr:hypothetical protein [Gammaproteobacteria bacterium]